MELKFSAESIRYRFSATIALVLVAGTIALSATIAGSEWLEQQSQLRQKGHGLAQYVAKLCQDPLIMNDSIQLDSIVNEARYDNDILYTVIIDRSGATRTSQFASINYRSPRIALLKDRLHGMQDIDLILPFIRNTEASVEVSAPVVSGSETIGRVVVCLSKHSIFSSILGTVAFIIAINTVVVIILTMILLAVSRRIIFDPISQLARAARRLAKGDLAVRLNGGAIGEMQQLIDSFNQMAEDLQQTTVSRDYVDNIIKSLSEALLIVAPDLTVSDVNDAAGTLLGYEPGELPGRHIGTLCDAGLLGSIATGNVPGQRISTESWCRTKDGRTIPVLFTASAMRDAAGKMQGFVCTALDIAAIRQVTEQLAAANETLRLEVAQRKQAQEETGLLNAYLEEQKSALEAANRELEAFSYSVSHDLRAPLRHINGFAAILNEDCRDSLDTTGRDCLARITNATMHMGTLIDELLNFSRVSRTEMQIGDVDLSECAAKIAAMFLESDPDRTASIDIAAGLTAKGDASLLTIALQNLIGNAWKYSATSPEASIAVGMQATEGAKVFYVQDNGVGFDMAYQDKLFQVFERLHGQEFEGTGIGLATVQRIIERHGGRIWAESEVGHGATFYFTLGTAA